MHPSYKDWVKEYYPHLYEVYYHIILPERAKIKDSNTVATVTFEEFCEFGYKSHFNLNGKRRI